MYFSILGVTENISYLPNRAPYLGLGDTIKDLLTPPSSGKPACRFRPSITSERPNIAPSVVGNSVWFAIPTIPSFFGFPSSSIIFIFNSSPFGPFVVSDFPLLAFAIVRATASLSAEYPDVSHICDLLLKSLALFINLPLSRTVGFPLSLTPRTLCISSRPLKPFNLASYIILDIKALSYILRAFSFDPIPSENAFI